QYLNTVKIEEVGQHRTIAAAVNSVDKYANAAFGRRAWANNTNAANKQADARGCVVGRAQCQTWRHDIKARAVIDIVGCSKVRIGIGNLDWNILQVLVTPLRRNYDYAIIIFCGCVCRLLLRKRWNRNSTCCPS